MRRVTTGWRASRTQAASGQSGPVRALAFLFFVLLLCGPPPSEFSLATGILNGGYNVTVSPGDTEIEQGSPVVILARFEGRLPSVAPALRSGGPGAAANPADPEPRRPRLRRHPPGRPVRRALPHRVRGHGTRDYTISVYQSPELLRADATIVYPSYTKLPEKTIEDTRQIGVVEGSEVTLTFTLNKPVATARLRPKTGIALALTVDDKDPNVLTASITASQSERYELHMADAQGRPNKMPPRFTIDVHKNLPAEVKPVFPQ